MPPHPKRRRNKKIEQICVLVEQQCLDGSDSISNSEQQRARLQLQEGYTLKFHSGTLCVLYPWHVVCCLPFSPLPQKECPIQLGTLVINLHTSTSKVMGKGSKPTTED